MKYGPLSLDQPAPWAHDGDDRTLGQWLLAGTDDAEDWDAVSGVDGLTDVPDGPIRDAFGEVIYLPGRVVTDYERLNVQYGRAPHQNPIEDNALTVTGQHTVPIWRPHGDK